MPAIPEKLSGRLRRQRSFGSPICPMQTPLQIMLYRFEARGIRAARYRQRRAAGQRLPDLPHPRSAHRGAHRRAARRPDLLGQLPRRQHADVRAQLLPARRAGGRAVLQLHPARPPGLPARAPDLPAHRDELPRASLDTALLLAGVGARYDAAQLRQWVTDARLVKPDTMMPPFGTTQGTHLSVRAQSMLSAEQIDQVLTLAGGVRFIDHLVDAAIPHMSRFTREQGWPLYLGTISGKSSGGTALSAKSPLPAKSRNARVLSSRTTSIFTRGMWARDGRTDFFVISFGFARICLRRRCNVEFPKCMQLFSFQFSIKVPSGHIERTNQKGIIGK